MNNPSFEELGLSKGLCKILADQGLTEPTDVQALAIPPLLSGQDVIGIAPTGTGKTLAYLLPIFQALRTGKFETGKGPVALVVTPSRELAVQVAGVAEVLAAKDDAVRVACLYGGTGLTAQRGLLREKPQIVVGTPGRIRDFYSSQELVLKSIKFLVLDEADRLMDMGFTPQLRAMLEVLPLKRQNLLFSATFNPKVEAASAEFLEWPIKVQAAKQATVPSTITEHFYETANVATKRNLLLHLLTKTDLEAGYVFCRSRQDANDVQAFLAGKGFAAEVLHANKGQNTRQQTLNSFIDGLVKWLVTTDVASRGLDVAAVPAVIQFGLPLDVRDYIHRTGRTGRAGIAGICHTFIDPGDNAHISALAKLLGHQIIMEPLPSSIPLTATPREETIVYEKAKDDIRRALDPSFKGAFHEKKDPRARAAAATRKKPNETKQRRGAKPGSFASKAKQAGRKRR